MQTAAVPQSTTKPIRAFLLICKSFATFSLQLLMLSLSTGWLMFGEPMPAVHFAGGALLMAGLLLNVFGASLFVYKLKPQFS